MGVEVTIALQRIQASRIVSLGSLWQENVPPPQGTFAHVNIIEGNSALGWTRSLTAQ